MHRKSSPCSSVGWKRLKKGNENNKHLRPQHKNHRKWVIRLQLTTLSFTIFKMHRHWNHYKSGQNHLTDFIGVEPSKKRKRRTSFTPQALELLNAHFERNTHPSGMCLCFISSLYDSKMFGMISISPNNIQKKKTKKIAMCISLPSWEIDVQFSHQNHTGHRVSQMHQFKFFSGVFFGSLQLKNVHLWCAKDSVVDFNYLIVHRVCVLVAFQL